MTGKTTELNIEDSAYWDNAISKHCYERWVNTSHLQQLRASGWAHRYENKASNTDAYSCPLRASLRS